MNKKRYIEKTHKKLEKIEKALKSLEEINDSEKEYNHRLKGQIDLMKMSVLSCYEVLNRIEADPEL